MKKIVLTILIFIFLFSIWFVYPIIYPYARAMYLLKFKFQQTQGKILNAEIEEIQQNAIVEEKIQTTKYYRPVFKYEYEVNGEKYVGTRYQAYDLKKGKSWAENILIQFPPNTEAKVFYNPDKPEKSFLTNEISDSLWNQFIGVVFFYFVIMLPFIIGGIGLLREMRLDYKKRNELYNKGFGNLVKRTEY